MKKALFYTFDIFLWYYGYNAFGCIYILLTLKNKKKISFANSYILGICSGMVFLSISTKSLETFNLTKILFFHFPVTLVLPTYGPFSRSASHILMSICEKPQYKNVLMNKRTDGVTTAHDNKTFPVAKSCSVNSSFCSSIIA